MNNDARKTGRVWASVVQAKKETSSNVTICTEVTGESLLIQIRECTLLLVQLHHNRPEILTNKTGAIRAMRTFLMQPTHSFTLPIFFLQSFREWKDEGKLFKTKL